jgi:hypothetical protein
MGTGAYILRKKVNDSVTIFVARWAQETERLESQQINECKAGGTNINADRKNAEVSSLLQTIALPLQSEGGVHPTKQMWFPISGRRHKANPTADVSIFAPLCCQYDVY